MKKKALSAAAKRVGMKNISAREAVKRELPKNHQYVEYDGIAIPYKRAMQLAKDMDTTLKAKAKGVKPLKAITTKLSNFFSDKPTFKNLGLRGMGATEKSFFHELAKELPWLNDKSIPAESKKMLIDRIIGSEEYLSAKGIPKKAIKPFQKYLVTMTERREGVQMTPIEIQGAFTKRGGKRLLTDDEFESMNRTLASLKLSSQEIADFKAALFNT